MKNNMKKDQMYMMVLEDQKVTWVVHPNHSILKLDKPTFLERNKKYIVHVNIVNGEYIGTMQMVEE